MSDNTKLEIKEEAGDGCVQELQLSKEETLDRKFGITMAVFLIALATFLLVVDLRNLELFNDMRIFGPGAFPALIFIILIILNIWNIIEIMTGKGSSAKLSKHIEFCKIKKSLRLFILIVLALLIMQVVGFVLAMMLFTYVEMVFLSEKKVKLPFVFGSMILLPLSIYFIFKLLYVNLPSPNWMPF